MTIGPGVAQITVGYRMFCDMTKLLIAMTGARTMDTSGNVFRAKQ
ncbi:hypothetical protein [Rhodococcus sp. ACPA1]|jgi:hypothetical protein|nr:hypothetical protein [Rhodococcus sp. ACPA1]